MKGFGQWIEEQNQNSTEEFVPVQQEQSQVVEEHTQEKRIVSFFKEVLSFIWHVFLAWAVACLIVKFVGTLSIVDGSSMYDTLEDGEHLWIDKLSYTFGSPERFDIVVFPFHGEEETVFYIKRIIALPGETIYIDEEGQIYIDDELLEENYGYETIDVDKRLRAENPVTLGADEYFVMGDNRNNSGDSRYELVGDIPENELLGKAVFRVWPLNKIGIVK